MTPTQPIELLLFLAYAFSNKVVQSVKQTFCTRKGFNDEELYLSGIDIHSRFVTIVTVHFIP